jgi:hypothetical protein
MFISTLASRCNEADAFPSGLRADVAEVVAIVSKEDQHTSRHFFTIIADGEALHIPYRLYYKTALLRRELSASKGVRHHIVACLGTRHHDGYVRQECLQALLGNEASWIAPFIIQLVGEYVVEIVEDIAQGMTERDAAAFARFARENPAYFATLERRVMSYWSCYHRQAYPERADYPGTIALAKIKAALNEI